LNPETHLLASWIIGAKTTDNARDCRLVAVAGILPDADGLGIVADFVRQALGVQTVSSFYYYQSYHHYLLHGMFGAVLITAVLTCFARQRWRVALLSLLVFHLHLLFDLAGSRGPDAGDIWPILYLSPFSRHPVWMWQGQWRLDGWQNRVISVALFSWALWLAVPLGYSVVGVFTRRLDGLVVRVLRKWHADLAAWWQRILGQRNG
jgi:inner membrane protein